MAHKILFKYTSRARVNNFFRGLDSIVNNLANKEDYYIQCSFDADDEVMNNPDVISRLHTYKKLVYYFGTSTGKVDAINKNLEKITEDWDIMVNFSDDQVFLIHGFDDIIRKDMPEDLDGFLHYLDGTPAKDILCTMSIIGRIYFKRFGYIYNPKFISVYCDNIATEIARVLGKYKFIDLQLYSHLHPAWGTGDKDYVYARNEDQELYAIDHKTYLEIKKNNYDL